MKTERRRWLKALAALPMSLALPAWADGLETLRQRGRLRIAVYNDFPPYSIGGGKGIDADLGRAIAAKLGLAAEIVGFNADEDMNDDLRNMVWKGHYLGTQPADLMLHVPVDECLPGQRQGPHFGPSRGNPGPARNPYRSGFWRSAAVALELFTRGDRVEPPRWPILLLASHAVCARMSAFPQCPACRTALAEGTLRSPAPGRTGSRIKGWIVSCSTGQVRALNVAAGRSAWPSGRGQALAEASPPLAELKRDAPGGDLPPDGSHTISLGTPAPDQLLRSVARAFAGPPGRAAGLFRQRKSDIAS